MSAQTPESNRNNQGEILPEVPPFIAPPEGQTPDSINLDFGVVQRTATGPSNDSDIETLFASEFSLSGNTALAGGTFFVESRTMNTFDSSNGGQTYSQIIGLTGCASGAAGRVDHSVITDWMYFARGFTNGGFTGISHGFNPIQGVTTEYADTEGNTLSDLYINTMDLVNVPYGDYNGVTGVDENTRTNNKILLVYGTGETGEGIVTLGRQEIQFTIVEEPRCGKASTGYAPDCQGYAYSGPTQGYIYYGDDDDQIVEWELAYFIYDREESLDENYHNSHITELFEKGSKEWNKVQKKFI